jgi:hypothetical protein
MDLRSSVCRRFLSLLRLACCAGEFLSPARAFGGTLAPFGSSYKRLAPQQQELVQRWIDEYEGIMQRKLDPETAYDSLALSTRTTFDAVTSVLLKTELTDPKTGEPMGNALDLVKLVESVHGEIKGSRGDEQFRVYVLLADDALAKLYRCKQFRHLEVGGHG